MVTLLYPLILAFGTLNQAAFGRPAPLIPRIAQISSATCERFEAACNRGGGGSEICRNLCLNTAPTILAAAPPCAQQDAADRLVDFAKQLNNNTAEMIKFAQLFAQQPRNTVRQVLASIGVLLVGLTFASRITERSALGPVLPNSPAQRRA